MRIDCLSSIKEGLDFKGINIILLERGNSDFEMKMLVGSLFFVCLFKYTTIATTLTVDRMTVITTITTIKIEFISCMRDVLCCGLQVICFRLLPHIYHLKRPTVIL